jgi:hypothetical protein
LSWTIQRVAGYVARSIVACCVVACQRRRKKGEQQPANEQDLGPQVTSSPYLSLPWLREFFALVACF